MQIETLSIVSSSDSILADIVPRGQHLLSTPNRTIFPHRAAIGYDTTTPDQLYVGDGIVWHPLGGFGSVPIAYAYLFSQGESGANLPANTGPSTGVVEFDNIDIQFASSGAFVFETDIGTGNVSGVQVPIAGDYSLDFSVTGGLPDEEIGSTNYGFGTGGVIVPGAGITYATVTGHVFKFGGEFMSFVRDPPQEITGSIIMHLTPTDILRVLNTSFVLLHLFANNGVEPVFTSLKISLLRAT